MGVGFCDFLYKPRVTARSGVGYFSTWTRYSFNTDERKYGECRGWCPYPCCNPIINCRTSLLMKKFFDDGRASVCPCDTVERLAMRHFLTNWEPNRLQQNPMHAIITLQAAEVLIERLILFSGFRFISSDSG